MGKFDINKIFEQQERLLQNNIKMKVEADKIGKEPKNARLKYLAIGFISMGLILELIILIWIDRLSYTTILWIQGFVGICAIMCVIFISVFLFRVNSKALNHRFNKSSKD